MRRLPRVSLPVLLGALVLLSAAAPAGAHSALSAVVPSDAGAPPRLDAVDAIVPVLGAAPAPPLLWYLPAALAIVAAAAWHSPRRVMVVALMLLLGVFAFENALHSVHHGLDGKQHEECATATASAHLAAVQVNGIVDAALVLRTAEAPADPVPTFALIRSLSPVQGRAPPFAIL